MASSYEPSEATTSLGPPASASSGAIGTAEPVSDGASAVDAELNTRERIESRVHQRLFDQAPVITKHIGRFRVLEQIGRGGMGMVYAAYDEQLDRRVAVKVLLDDELPSEQDRQRFQREAQALARLSHPNVVTVHEVGESDGRFFLAMEYIRGRSLRAWLKTRPEWPQVLDAFVQAGQGMVAAHDAELVHRDLKPANIMRAEDGTVKVLDFGLARVATDLLDESIEQASLTRSSNALSTSVTRTGAVMGTPAYMAPEQFGGDAIDARTDQYSFCVALWEGLAGQRPFEVARDAKEDVDAQLEAKLSGPPAWPDSAPSLPRGLVEALRRGLSAQPDQRWPSMEELLAELRRLSAPPSRRWWPWTLGAGLLAVGGAAVAVPRFAALQERCSGAEAQIEGIWDDARRQQVRTAVAEARPSEVESTWARIEPRLDDYAQTWVDTHTEVCEATVVRAEQTEDAMQLRMGCLHDRKVALDAAITVLAAADGTVASKAVPLVEALPSMDRCDDLHHLQRSRQRVPPPQDPRVAHEVETLREQLAGSRAELEAGRYADALDHVRPVVQRAEALGYEPLLAEALMQRGGAKGYVDDFAGGERDLERAFELAVEQGQDEVAADALAGLAFTVGVWQERHERGRWWGQMAVAVSRGPEIDPSIHIRALRNLGLVLYKQGELAEGLDSIQRAVAIKEQQQGPPDSMLAILLDNLGLLLLENGRTAESLSHHQRALVIGEDVLGPHHRNVAHILVNLGVALREQGESLQALEQLQRALVIMEEVSGPDHTSVASVLDNLTGALFDLGRYEEGLEHLERALAIKEDKLGPDHPEVAITLDDLGTLLAGMEQYPEALEYLNRALAIRERVLSPTHTLIGRNEQKIGAVLFNTGKVPEAEIHLQRSLTIMEQAVDADHPDLARVLLLISQAALLQDDFAKARAIAQRALSGIEDREDQRALVAEARMMLARATWHEPGQQVRARELAEQARRTFEQASAGEALEAAESWLAEHREP